MTEAKVYYSDMRAHGRSLLSKLRRLMKEAGFESIDFDGKFVAVKIHFGEPGNLAYLRPNWAAEVCDYIRELGGKPFLTDCNTLYVGGRKNALDHLDSAYKNGYNPFQTGVHTIIADGLKGTDEALRPRRGRRVCQGGQDRPRSGMDADIIISLTHFKGHETDRLRRRAEEPRHGLRLPRGQDGDALALASPSLTRNCASAAGACARICAHGAHHASRSGKAHHRPRQLRRLRPLHRRLSRGRGDRRPTTRPTTS